MNSILSRLSVSTTWGAIEVDVLQSRIAQCTMPPLTAAPRVAFGVTGVHRSMGSVADTSILNKAQAYIEQLFAGKKRACPPLAPQSGTDFVQRVWAELRKIPLGTVLTYGELAERAGSPGAARAVGQACGANPLPLFVPCHRVIAANQSLGGFSCGRAWKKLLLDCEQSLEADYKKPSKNNGIRVLSAVS